MKSSYIKYSVFLYADEDHTITSAATGFIILGKGLERNYKVLKCYGRGEGTSFPLSLRSTRIKKISKYTAY